MAVKTIQASLKEESVLSSEDGSRGGSTFVHEVEIMARCNTPTWLHSLEQACARPR